VEYDPTTDPEMIERGYAYQNGLLGQPGNEFDDDVNDGDQWSMGCCGADYDCICP
jgi:hypothetical protein